jgi:putative Holliday junction resolvase
MIFEDFSDFIKVCPSGALLGIDLGKKLTGLAVSDSGRSIATPHKTIENKFFSYDIGEIQKVVDAKSITGLVFGLPLNMDGSKSELCLHLVDFISHLEKRINLPVYLQDERFSSKAASRSLLETELSARKRNEAQDRVAASYILQTVLDRIGYLARQD